MLNPDTADELTVDLTGDIPHPATVDLISPAARHQHDVIDLVTVEAVVSPEPRVSVVIPTLNEAKNLPHVAARMPEVHQIVIVDGRSTDNTIETALKLWPQATIVRQNRKGKGNALACGFAACTGDVIVMLDADGSADPLEIPNFVAALVAGADFAKGSRFAQGGSSFDITPFRRLGNRALNGLVNMLYRTRYTDLCYGYNAFTAECLSVIQLELGAPGTPCWGDGFEVETMINVRIAKAGLTVAEVPSIEHPRIFGASNLNAVRDGFRVLDTIRRERRRPAGVLTRRAASDSVPAQPGVQAAQPTVQPVQAPRLIEAAAGA